MAETVLVSILCPDRIGLVASITGGLYDIGTNLFDTTFAVLGGAAEFTAVCELPEHVSLATVSAELHRLEELDGAEIHVSAFEMAPVHAESAHITHRIELSGGDQPGLIARLSEVFVQFGANIVRLNSEKVPGTQTDEYVIRVAVWIPEDKSRACIATIANTAGELRLKCTWAEA